MALSQFLRTIKQPVNLIHYRRLLFIDQHDYSQVKKKVSQETGNDDQDYLNTGIEYLKRYYALHIIDPLNEQGISKPVDDFWHFHTLFSRDYMNFCDKVFGGYLHHNPLLTDDSVSMSDIADVYSYSYQRHVDIFTNIDDRFIGPDAATFMCCSSDVNNISAELAQNAIFERRIRKTYDLSTM